MKPQKSASQPAIFAKSDKSRQGKAPLVVKFGTGVLSKPGGGALNKAQFRRIAEEISGIIQAGTPCVIVSSASIAAGVSELGMVARPEDLPGKQACAAVGQPCLMRLYSASFRCHGFRVAQLLLTHGDIDSRMRRENARTTLQRLLATQGIVPVINENDSVAVEELRFGDNDRLCAEVAILVGASRLLIATSSDGLTDSQGRRIPLVRDMQKAFSLVRPETGKFSVGGMRTKLEAVKIALSAGIPTTIFDGRHPGQIARAAQALDTGTHFPAIRPSRSQSRTQA